MVDGIKYEKSAARFVKMALFENNELEIYLDQFTFTVSKQDKTIYEAHIPLDSSIENQFARDCESHENIEFFFKLPLLVQDKYPHRHIQS